MAVQARMDLRLATSLSHGSPHAMLPPEWTSSPADPEALYLSPSQRPQLLPDPQDGGSNLVRASIKSCPAVLSAHTGPLYGSQTQHSREPPSTALVLGSTPRTSQQRAPQTDFPPGTLPQTLAEGFSLTDVLEWSLPTRR